MNAHGTATVEGIWTADTSGAEPAPVAEARLEAGRGIAGDRYHAGTGTFSPTPMDPDHQLTLIAAEEIEAFNAATGQTLGHGAFRRNVVTRGLDLNALVGVRFRIGSAEVRGVRLCEPCAHLASLLGGDVLKRMVHRAGLRAEIVGSGTVRAGDRVEAP